MISLCKTAGGAVDFVFDCSSLPSCAHRLGKICTVILSLDRILMSKAVTRNTFV